MLRHGVARTRPMKKTLYATNSFSLGFLEGQQLEAFRRRCRRRPAASRSRRRRPERELSHAVGTVSRGAAPITHLLRGPER